MLHAHKDCLQDGVIHKDEFAFALFKSQNHSNTFADKVSIHMANPNTSSSHEICLMCKWAACAGV